MEEHNVPEISGIARFFVVIPFLTILSIFSTGLNWNALFDISGIMLPTFLVAIVGSIIMAIIGSFVKIEDKINPYVVVAYILGYLISFGMAYYLFNNYITSMPQFAVIIILFVLSLPGFGLLSFVQSRYNKKLHKEYWDEYERRNNKI